MSKNSQLYRMMAKELPDISSQGSMFYHTSQREVTRLFNLINEEIFNSKLPTPEFKILTKSMPYWGMCVAKSFYPKPNESVCLIKLSNKWFCKHWLITILAHEMCHQYQYDIDGLKRMKRGLSPIMSHGPSFFYFKNKLEKHGISLKRAHSQSLWLKHQNLFKC